MAAGPKHVLPPPVCGLVIVSAKPDLPAASWSLRPAVRLVLTSWVLARSCAMTLPGPHIDKAYGQGQTLTQSAALFSF